MYNPLDQSNNSNNNNFGAPMGYWAKQTKSIQPTIFTKNFNKSLQENNNTMNNVKDNRSMTYKAPNNLSNKYFGADNNINKESNNQQISSFSMSSNNIQDLI